MCYELQLISNRVLDLVEKNIKAPAIPQSR